MTTVNNTLEQTLEQAKNLPPKKFDIFMRVPLADDRMWGMKTIEARTVDEVIDSLEKVWENTDLKGKEVEIRIYRNDTTVECRITKFGSIQK